MTHARVWIGLTIQTNVSALSTRHVIFYMVISTGKKIVVYFIYLTKGGYSIREILSFSAVVRENFSMPLGAGFGWYSSQYNSMVRPGMTLNVETKERQENTELSPGDWICTMPNRAKSIGPCAHVNTSLLYVHTTYRI